MYSSGRRHKGVTLDVWPGFVDALATLLIVMIFALMIFVVSQIYLSDALQGSQRGVESLQAKLQELSRLLQIEQKKSVNLQALKSQVEADLTGRAATAEADLALIKQQIEALNEQLHKLNLALEASDTEKSKQKLTIEDLDNKLKVALAKKVEDLEKYRSEFFGKLKELLANRSDVRIVGDRFVFQSEVLFPSASATLEKAGESQLQQLAETLKEISSKMPKDLKWVLRVDGHTDTRPIHSGKFDSNWELSAARAISVVKFLNKEGIPAEHLAATGFGEFHPIEKPGDNARNRRIELKLDQR